MKTLTALVGTLSLLVVAQSAAAKPAHVLFRTSGVTTPREAQVVEHRLQALPGVTFAYAARGYAGAAYDDTQVNPMIMKSVLERQGTVRVVGNPIAIKVPAPEPMPKPEPRPRPEPKPTPDHKCTEEACDVSID